MKRKETVPRVGFGARAPRDDVLAFEALFDPVGAKIWFLESSIRQFLDICQVSPEIEKSAHVAIQHMLYRADEPDEAGNTRMFIGRITLDLYNEFNKVFPEYGATAWFIRSALTEYLALSRMNPTPESLFFAAADHVAKAVAAKVA